MQRKICDSQRMGKMDTAEITAKDTACGRWRWAHQACTQGGEHPYLPADKVSAPLCAEDPSTLHVLPSAQSEMTRAHSGISLRPTERQTQETGLRRLPSLSDLCLISRVELRGAPQTWRRKHPAGSCRTHLRYWSINQRKSPRSLKLKSKEALQIENKR